MNLTYNGASFKAPDEPLFEMHFGDEREIIEGYWHPKAGQVAWDVGAGAGRYTMPALAAGATVIALEPRADWREGLCRCAQFNDGFFDRLAALPFAVFDGTEPADMMGMIERTPNLDLSPRGAQFTTLDNLVIDMNVSGMDWLKVDVEGQELGVLAGGYSTICRYRPQLLIEDHSRVYPELGDEHHKALMGWLGLMEYAVEKVGYEHGVPRDYLIGRP